MVVKVQQAVTYQRRVTATHAGRALFVNYRPREQTKAIRRSADTLGHCPLEREREDT